MPRGSTRTASTTSRPLEGHVHIRRRERLSRPRSRACCISSSRSEAAIIASRMNNGVRSAWRSSRLAGHKLAREEIHAHCAANLARFQMPAPDRVCGCPAAQCDGEDPQTHLAKTFSTPKVPIPTPTPRDRLPGPGLRFSPLSPQQKTEEHIFMNNKKFSCWPPRRCLPALHPGPTRLAQKKYDTGRSDNRIKIGNCRGL